MSCCGHCQDAGDIFNEKTAKKELKRYLKKGPNKSTRLLLDEIRRHDINGQSLLDIGSGVGTISFELMKNGLDTSVSVDASVAYQKVFKSEAEMRGIADRIHQIFGDFTTIPEKIKEADIVTLDRVICCYPDMEKLIDRSAEKAKRFYGVVYPRSRWSVRMVMLAGNIWFRMQKSNFRTYVHPPSEIDERIRSNGFQRVRLIRTLIWETALYEKVN